MNDFTTSTIHSLGAGERIYFGGGQQPELKTISLPSVLNEDKMPETVEKRRAKRKEIREAMVAQVKKEHQDEKAKWEKYQAMRREQERKEFEERKAAKRKQRELDRLSRQIRAAPDALKAKVPGHKFEPVVGVPNALGYTPVYLNEKTVILVRPGKDVNRVIETYRKSLTKPL